MYEFETNNFGLGISGSVSATVSLLFPNPFSLSSVLRFDNARAEAFELRIFDISGKVVRHYNNLTGQSVVIERGNMREGIYFYSLTTGGVNKASGKFVIVSAE